MITFNPCNGTYFVQVHKITDQHELVDEEVVPVSDEVILRQQLATNIIKEFRSGVSIDLNIHEINIETSKE